MTSRASKWVKEHPVLAFYILAFAISWAGYLPGLAYTHGLFPFQSALFFVLGGVGPTLAAVAVVYMLHGKDGPKELFRPLTRWRVGVLWYIVALLAYPAIWLVAVYLPGDVSLDVENLNPAMIIPLFISSVLMNVWEEIGWRDFALPRLQARYSALASSLIVGVLWGLWHLPLLLMKGYPMASYPPVPFFVGIIAASVLYTWIFNGTGGSLLLVTLFHAAGNATAGFLGEGVDIPGAIPYTALVTFVAAVIVVALFGWENLSRSGRTASSA
ncbi:hypothetical protein A3L11_02620 [Thermococcus siculi]|uniref:CAAX prenyl protease 2/Lysostaphin resistance protein A-like domain-containing protein n=2 Tax=Thermococcus siculi TaxID=72803 RepID=A0A2Z2MQX3_9EURY|nr:hypothetical protein A3L11_02620 [Thermococcus siculi]